MLFGQELIAFWQTSALSGIKTFFTSIVHKRHKYSTKVKPLKWHFQLFILNVVNYIFVIFVVWIMSFVLYHPFCSSVQQECSVHTTSRKESPRKRQFLQNFYLKLSYSHVFVRINRIAAVNLDSKRFLLCYKKYILVVQFH